MLTSSKESVDSQLLDAEIIQKYFNKCGKVIELDKIKSMLDECGLKSDETIDFETFYQFMISFLDDSQRNTA